MKEELEFRKKISFNGSKIIFQGFNLKTHRFSRSMLNSDLVDLDEIFLENKMMYILGEE